MPRSRTRAELGASVADYQPQDHVRVMVDPVGHPFCLYVDAGDEESDPGGGHR